MPEHISQHTVLIVDDTPESMEVLGNILRPKLKVMIAKSGKKAIEIAQSSPLPDLILLDIMMPEMDGYETCARLKSDSRTCDIPVIFITALTDTDSEARGLELGAVDYISKPFNPSLVQARVNNHIELKRHRDKLEFLVQKRTEELELTKKVTITAMGSLAEYRDPETGAHILRTQHYVKAIAETLSDHPRFSHYLDPETIDLFYKSAPLHDIGKVAIPDNILLKPGKLTDQEFEEMKKHTVYGYDALMNSCDLLGKNSFLRIACSIAISHHEKWDGSGYPYALKGDEIPVEGRIMALADVYDALISKRVYKPAFSHEKALKIINEGKGQHFDPDIVEAFMSIEDKIKEIALEHADK